MTRSPLRIRRATIKNFRGIDELEVDFPEADEPSAGGVLVLGGDNGFGKTSVLEALLLGLGQTALLPPDSAPLSEQVRFGQRDFSLTLDVQFDERSQTLSCDRATLERPTLTHTSRGGGVVEAPNGPFWQLVGFLEPRVVYISARRDPDTLGEPAADARGERSPRESRRVAELKRTVAQIFNRQRDPRARGSSEQAQRSERLQRFVKRFLGDDAIVDVMFLDDSDRNGQDVVLRRGELPDGVATLADARRRALTSGDVPLVLPIDRLSAGQLALFAFAEPLLFSTGAPDLVLIDEPERHLHVQWQRVIIPALQELTPTSQFVVATHSHEVMRSVTSDEVLYLLPRDDPRRPRPAAVAGAAK
jgi:AAA domain, putative AbiEii toxin, Type IV TA system